MFPKIKSGGWFIVYIIYAVVVFIALLISRAMLSNEVLLRNITGMLILSLSSSSLPCIAGYFGKRLFFMIYSVALILGLVYVYYVIIDDIAPGWSDLTSIIGFLFIVGVGALTAFIAELISFFVKMNRKNK